MHEAFEKTKVDIRGHSCPVGRDDVTWPWFAKNTAIRRSEKPEFDWWKYPGGGEISRVEKHIPIYRKRALCINSSLLSNHCIFMGKIVNLSVYICCSRGKRYTQMPDSLQETHVVGYHKGAYVRRDLHFRSFKVIKEWGFESESGGCLVLSWISSTQFVWTG